MDSHNIINFYDRIKSFLKSLTIPSKEPPPFVASIYMTQSMGAITPNTLYNLQYLSLEKRPYHCFENRDALWLSGYLERQIF